MIVHLIGGSRYRPIISFNHPKIPSMKQHQEPMAKESGPTLKDFLGLPIDDTLMRVSPPCSPVPANWHEMIESPPTKLISDLESEFQETSLIQDKNKVNIYGGEGEEAKGHWKLAKRKVYKPINQPQPCSIVGRKGPKPPTIIIDSYEYKES